MFMILGILLGPILVGSCVNTKSGAYRSFFQGHIDSKYNKVTAPIDVEQELVSQVTQAASPAEMIDHNIIKVILLIVGALLMTFAITYLSYGMWSEIWSYLGGDPYYTMAIPLILYMFAILAISYGVWVYNPSYKACYFGHMEAKMRSVTGVSKIRSNKYLK